jgi:hypothetical protein
MAELVCMYGYGLNLSARSLLALRVLAESLVRPFMGGFVTAFDLTDFVWHSYSPPFTAEKGAVRLCETRTGTC